MKQKYFTLTSKNQNRHLAYLEWGNARNPVVVCIHGLTRNAHDFNALAVLIADKYHVLCFDMAGRGKSDWLENSIDYTYPTYIQDMIEAIYGLGLKNVNFIGTSMGGIIGMMLAALPETVIKKLIINDVGPFLPKEAIRRISTYLTLELPPFPDLKAAESHLRLIHAPFGPLTDKQWQDMTLHSTKQTEAGLFKLHYDPAIADVFSSFADEDIEFWQVWDDIKCPVLVLRGANSDILLEKTAKKMADNNDKAQLVTFDGIGHAPALLNDDQTSIVLNWLNT